MAQVGPDAPSRAWLVPIKGHLDLDDEVLALAEAHLAELDVDIDAGVRDHSTGRSRNLADAEPARFRHPDVQAQVHHRDRHDTAHAAGQGVAQVVCDARKG